MACQGNGSFLFGDELKRKYAIWLICLLLFVAAVDTIPDPPAISAPSSHSCGISSFHVRGTFTPLEKGWFSGSSAPELELRHSFIFRLALDNRPFGISPLPRVHHAADISPPSFS